jgi:hypothetical protein
MEGAPGHQASALNSYGNIDPDGSRGGYGNSPTLGGFDQMAARLGGFWDSMLAEGRRWWITATSDSHVNWREGGSDFWPGEYSKTYVHSRRDHADILDGLRSGRVFVTTGDLITSLDVTATVPGKRQSAFLGGELSVMTGQDVDILIEVRDPAAPNQGGKSPSVARVDLIVGDVTGPAADRTTDRSPSTRVERRFTAADWRKDGEKLIMRHRLQNVQGPLYIRVRGTSTSELEPVSDPKGEDPWSDLWFYGNPVFVKTTPRSPYEN